ncbi:MAG: ureidoglycolate lyase [Cucumibacter sp.]
MQRIAIELLTREAFAPFGQVIEASGAARHFPINDGMAERFDDLAPVTATGAGARAILSIIRDTPHPLPLTLKLVERHPFGSQAFVPLSDQPFLVIVSPDEGGMPGTPRAFMTRPGQGVNYPAGQWHGVLTALYAVSDFLVVDRGGEGQNLEEHRFAAPYLVGEPE